MDTPNLVLLHTSALLYIITGFLFLEIARVFWRSRNGALRKALIFLFLAIAMGVLTRGSWLLFELSDRVASNAVVSMFSIGCVFSGAVIFRIVIRKILKN